MSRELIFPLSDGAALERAKNHFRERAHYTVSDDQIVFEDEDSGCHFAVEFATGENRTEAEDRISGPSVTFSINYARPKPFLAQAVDEIEVYNRAFPGPYLNEETGELEAFDRVSFTAAWQSMSDRFVRKFEEEKGEGLQIVFAAARQVEVVWAWNRNRHARQSAEGDDVFVPTLKWIKRPGTRTALTAVVCMSATPMVFPQAVELALMGRPVTAKPSFLKRFFGRNSEAEVEWRLQSVDQVVQAGILRRASLDGFDCFRLDGTDSRAFDRLFANGEPLIPGADSLVHPYLVLEEEVLKG